MATMTIGEFIIRAPAEDLFGQVLEVCDRGDKAKPAGADR